MSEISRARTLRSKATWAEKLFWSWVRDRRFHDYKFRRQHPVGKYTVDFYCEEARLAVELDGSMHGRPERVDFDRLRDEFLELQGITVVRFWNGQLRREKQYVRDKLFRLLHGRSPRPQPAYLRPGRCESQARTTCSTIGCDGDG
jgi:adenine-specific DNA-methyltransferase